MKKNKIIFYLFTLSLLLVPFTVFAENKGACTNASSSLSCSYTDGTTAECSLIISSGDYENIDAYSGTLGNATLKSVDTISGVSNSSSFESSNGKFLTLISSALTEPTGILKLTIDNINDSSNVTLSSQSMTINTEDDCNLADVTATFENIPVENTSNQQKNPHTANENIAYIGLVIVALGIIGLIILNKRKLKI